MASARPPRKPEKPLIDVDVRPRERAGEGTPPKTVSRQRKPPELSVEAWQAELRRQHGAKQKFAWKNVGDEPVFSEFDVCNPDSGNTYKVAIRGAAPGDNFCSCPDFQTNTLGTCKHVEFVLAKLRDKRGGETALARGFQPAYSEVYLWYGGEREVRFRPGTGCPRELARLAAHYFDAEGRLPQAAFRKFDEFLSAAGRIDHDLRVYEDVLGYAAQLRDAERRQQLVAREFPRGIASAAFKNLLKMPLYDYQREGVLFLAKAGRSLLGDEMGLGKTMQAIGAAEVMARLFGVERVLVVCPTSLKHQWEREIRRACDRSVEVIGGLRARRQEGFKSDTFFKAMNYDTVYLDLDLIRQWAPDLVILDEAQRIKNWATRTANSVKKIESPYAIVATGTPLENRLEELISIVQFVDRHRLGPTFRLLNEHQKRDEFGRVVGYRDLDRIGRTLAPVLLRRHKDEVIAQLPERLEKRFFVPMTPQQDKYHRENMQTVGQIVKKWRRRGFLTEAEQRMLMISLQNMRMACNSTYLLDRKTDFGYKADELVTLLDELYERPDAKVVVFSQWVGTHELLQRRFDKRRWDYVLFHGGVPGMKRKGLIDRFREDRGCRAFLSTDAGGVGLNLQHANVVVNMDLPWNPAVLEQRIGRVHRLGQTRPVQVVNFVAKATIEEGMLEVLAFKKSLFAGVLDGGEKEVFLGGGRLKKFMETVEKIAERIPEAVAEEPGAAAEAAKIEPQDAPKTLELALAGSRGAGADSRGGESGGTGLPVAGGGGLAALLQAGIDAFQQAAQAPTNGGANGTGGLVQAFAQFVQVDADPTGQPVLKFKLPPAAAIDQALDALKGVLRSWSR